MRTRSSNAATFRDRIKDETHVLLLNDGIGMDLAARLLYGRPFRENLNGTDGRKSNAEAKPMADSLHRLLRVLGMVASLIWAGSVAAASERADIPFLAGVNLAGGEFRAAVLPGVHGTDYIYPTLADMKPLLERSFNTFRIPFRWERLQRDLFAPLHEADAIRLDGIVREVTGRGGFVILDMHNHARYGQHIVGSPELDPAALADAWRRLAERYRDNDRVVFGLMNEPMRMPTEQWLRAANAALRAIRATGAENLVLVPGNGWSGAHSWFSSSYGTPNSAVMTGIEDPLGNVAVEVHQYLDNDSSGRSTECPNVDAGAAALSSFTAWLDETGNRGFLGEFGGGASPECLEAVDRMLSVINRNAHLWIGWTAWAAGPWWGDYPFNLTPRGEDEPPQLRLLVTHARQTMR